MDAKHNQLLADYEQKFAEDEITTAPKAFIKALTTKLIKKEIDVKELVKIHQQLYLYYYKIIKDTDFEIFFKDPNNTDFRDTLYKIYNNDNFKQDIKSLKSHLTHLYSVDNTLKIKIDAFLDDVTRSHSYIANIINIFKLYNNQRIDIKFIKAKINTEINAEIDTEIDADKKQLKTSFFDSRNTTKKSFLKTILRITGRKGINNQKKQLLYFCQLFSELKSNDYKDINTSLKTNYDALITTLKDHISHFLKKTPEPAYAIIPTDKTTPNIASKEKINHIETLNKLKKYILNESLINELIKEYNTYFNSNYKKSEELKEQKENEEYREVAKSKSEEHKKEFTHLIPLTPTEQIGQFSTSALSTVTKSFENIQSKLPAYLNNIIIIIIFLIFLNLFITTYFYFTTSIQATANRSNCGGASLCEAETHRHLFLEDNGNDKARDIYIIIVVIFSIYLLSEIFKSYSANGIDFTDTDIVNQHKIKNAVILVSFFGSMLLAQFARYYFQKYYAENSFDKMTRKPEMKVFMYGYSACSGLALIACFFINGLDGAFIKYIMGFIVAIALIYDIYKLIVPQSTPNDTFKSANFNSKFKPKTAIDILSITFYCICIGILLLNITTGDITILIVALSLLAVLLATLFIFILNSSVDWSRYANKDDYNRYFEIFHRSIFLISGIFPGLLALLFNSKQNIIKLIVFYYAILFIIYLFYVYFINHNNESGILSLAYFQLYNYVNINKNENTKGSDNTVYKFTTEGGTEGETKNYYKQFNQINVYFVVVLLIILIVIGGLNTDPNLDGIIYGIIVFILASYITGIVYLLYNTIFPIQQASFKYKKNLVDINNEISQHIKVEVEEHTIDKNKIRVFKIAKDDDELKDIHKRINSERNDGTTDKEMHMKNIRDIFSEISPKGSSYEDYRSQSTDQMQYEEYIYLLFNNDNNSNAINQYNYDYYSNLLVATNKDDSFYEVPSLIAPTNKDLYNQIILNVPNTLRDIDYDIDIKYKNEETAYLSNLKLNIPKTNIIEYVIKKNYKYVTGEEGEIQKYNVLSDTELSCLYYSSNVARTETSTFNNSNLEESIKESIKNYDKTKFKITNIATDTDVKTTNYFPIYKLNQDIFDDFKNDYNSDGDPFTFQLGDDYYSNMLSKDVKNEKKLPPAFYTIGYDYENYTYTDGKHQQMNKDTAYSIPARYYACSYLNYFPNEDGSMSKVKFAKNIKEDNYNPLNTKNTIIDRIAKRYDENAKETKIQLAPEKFQFLLVFLVILAIILLMFLFNIIKKYFTGDVYTPQMYVLGILGVFLTIFIFGEVIFARIK